jgi:hypothetical protein
MKKQTLLLSTIMLVFTGCGAQQVTAPKVEENSLQDARRISVNLADQNESRQNGSIVFYENKDSMTVSIILKNKDSVTNDQPVQILSGRCDSLKEKRFDLINLDSPSKEFFAPINIERLQKNAPLAVVILKSIEDNSVQACGDIGSIVNPS